MGNMGNETGEASNLHKFQDNLSLIGTYASS